MTKNSHDTFLSAAKAIKQSDKQPGLHKVTHEEKMKLYALYKQAIEGDCKTSKPTQNMETDEYQKCDAWCKLKGIKKQDAQKQYVQMARNMLNKYGANKLIDF